MKTKKSILRKQLILLILAFLSVAVGFDLGGMVFSFFLYMTLGQTPDDEPQTDPEKEMAGESA